MIEIELINPTDEDFSKLEGLNVRTIRSDGNNSALSDKALQSLQYVIDLEELDLEWAQNITDKGLSYLEGIKTLKYVDLSFCGKITNSGIKALQIALPELEIER